MTGGSPVFISCPSCAAKYRWKEELAGKKIKCAKCQAILRMPAESAGEATVIHKPAEEHAAPAAAPARPAAAAPARPTPPPAAAPAPPHPAQEEQHERKPMVDAYDVDDGEETTPPAPAPPRPAAAPAAAPKPAAPAHAPAKPASAKAAPAKPAGKPSLDASIGLAGDVSLPPAAEAPAAAGASKCPSCGNALGREAVICLNCGYNVKAGAKVQTSVEAGGEEDGGDEAKPKGFKAKLLALTKKKPRKEAEAEPEAPPEAPGGLKGKLAAANKKKATQAEDAEKIEKWAKMTDIYIPIGLVVAGFPIAVWQKLYADQADRFSTHDMTINQAMVRVGVEVAVLLVLLFVTMMLATKLLDLVFGAPHTAMAKLLAIALGPGAIGGIIGIAIGDLTGLIVGSIVSMGCFYGLLMLLFGLTLAEAAMMVVLLGIVQRVGTLFLLSFVMSMFEK